MCVSTFRVILAFTFCTQLLVFAQRCLNCSTCFVIVVIFISCMINPLDSKGNYSAESNNMKLVHWPLMGGLLHLVQQGGALARCGPTQSHPRCTECNSPPINGQCTNHCCYMMVRCSAVLMWRSKS